MKLLILALLIFPVTANAFDILYNMNGEQRLEGFGPGGSTSGQVVWDTSKDGELPKDAPVGYAERFVESGMPRLRANLEMKATMEKRAAELAAKEAEEFKLQADFKKLADKVKADTATPPEMRKVLKVLLQKQGL